jgi:hypothetical protein
MPNHTLAAVIINIRNRALQELRRPGATVITSEEQAMIRAFAGGDNQLITELSSILFRDAEEAQAQIVAMRPALDEQAALEEQLRREQGLDPREIAALPITPANQLLQSTGFQQQVEAVRSDPQAQQQALIQVRDAAISQRRTFINSEEQAMLRRAGVPQDYMQELAGQLFQIEQERQERERLQGIQTRQIAAIEGLPSRLQNQTGISALTALGSFPDRPQTELGNILPNQLLQSIGFGLPEGASAGAGLQPQQFFSGGLPTVSQLQNFNQQELGLLGGIVSLGGTGEPFDLRRSAAGVTPLPAGSVTGAAGGLPDIAPQARPRTRRI